MKSNYFKIFFMVSIVSGFQEKGFGGNVPQPVAEVGAPSVAVGVAKPAASVPLKAVVSKPVKLVFEKVPKIHSVAYHYTKAVKPGHHWDVDNVRNAIRFQMVTAWYVIAKNIEKQKNAGLPFTDDDLKKFQLPSTKIDTYEYYVNRHLAKAIPQLDPYITARGNHAVQACDLQDELVSYGQSLNDDLTARMKGAISSVPVDPAKKSASNAGTVVALSAADEDEDI